MWCFLVHYTMCTHQEGGPATDTVSSMTETSFLKVNLFDHSLFKMDLLVSREEPDLGFTALQGRTFGPMGTVQDTMDRAFGPMGTRCRSDGDGVKTHAPLDKVLGQSTALHRNDEVVLRQCHVTWSLVTLPSSLETPGGKRRPETRSSRVVNVGVGDGLGPRWEVGVKGPLF